MSEEKNDILPGADDDQYFIWEQIPGESNKAYAAFCAYRSADSYHRSIDVVYRQVTKARGRASGGWRTWSTRFNWQDRAVAFDTYKDRSITDKIITAKAKSEIVETKKEAVDMADSMLTLISERLNILNNSDEELPSKDIPTWFKVALDLKLMSLGDVPKSKLDVSTLGTEQKIEVVFKDAPGEAKSEKEAEEFIEEHASNIVERQADTD